MVSSNVTYSYNYSESLTIPFTRKKEEEEGEVLIGSRKTWIKEA